MKKERSFQQNVLRQLDITCKKKMTPTSHHIQNSTQNGSEINNTDILHSTGKYSHYLIVTLYTHTHTHTHTHPPHGMLFSLKKNGNSDIFYNTMNIQILGEGNGNLLQYSRLENPMDRGAGRATVHGVAKSQTRLSMHTP